MAFNRPQMYLRLETEQWSKGIKISRGNNSTKSMVEKFPGTLSFSFKDLGNVDGKKKYQLIGSFQAEQSSGSISSRTMIDEYPTEYPSNRIIQTYVREIKEKFELKPGESKTIWSISFQEMPKTSFQIPITIEEAIEAADWTITFKLSYTLHFEDLVD
ncbi:hypothetical protein KIH39_11230 [Telmatocola sphagniphila]|uniref:Uncharacterized protein n=1 Tax=Telmatocola sphagniphila TaxID=1123043 RepID=A0A8E6BAU2_9BACT|nr:hypothetical protein [Telmatocola sphagniphila]QVL34449.1 hypothetical protein KIH39_11230 [Telmatocola sphagniphila]